MAKNGRYTYIDKPTRAGQDILEGVFDPNHTHPVVRKMSISVDADCTVLINGRDLVKIKPNLGLQLSYDDIEVSTMVTQTDGVNFYAIIAY